MGFVIVRFLQEGPRDQVLALVFGLRNRRGTYRSRSHAGGTKSLGFGGKGMSDREFRLGQEYVVWKRGLEEYNSGKGKLNHKKTLAKFLKNIPRW